MSQDGNIWDRRGKLLFLMVAGAIGIMFLVIGVYQLVEFTDSTAFCGRLCHTVMYPEYTVYQASPHSRVTCAECHVGSGADYLVKSKLSGIPLIFTTLTGTYHKPIPTPVQNLRPARETCENCHRPEEFLGDVVRTHTTYKTDEVNTAVTDTRILRIGGGHSEAAKDIHWHIAANVYYLPLDEKREQIAWVGVEEKDGSLTEYVNPDLQSQVNQERIDSEKRLMDCIDCHNRATHIFQSPENLIDDAMTQGRIDTGLPYIKREAMQALNTTSSSLQEAYDRVAAIGDFYKTSYPELATKDSDKINAALGVLDEVARLTVFPVMNVNWETYSNNVDHTGCFRCHGKLTGLEGTQQGQAISSDCTLCHYFP